MIIEKTVGENEKIYVYKEVDNKEKRKLFNNIIASFADYASKNGFSYTDIQIDFRLLNEINVRVDKRRDYYIIFHEKRLSEVREAALYAYWILKYKPFLVTSEDEEKCNFNINCGFALYVIFSVVSEYIERISDGKERFCITEEYTEKLLYAFKYWDLSKESMMMIAEMISLRTEEI